jgi:hypothetical protein
MMKPGVVALMGLAMVWGASSAQAQLILARPSSVPPRPGTPGGAGPLTPLFGGAPAAPTFTPGIGSNMGVGGFGPGIGMGGFGAGLGAGAVGAETGATGLLGIGVLNPAMALNQGNVTGHPVAFQNHRAYFLNLNAAAGNVGLIGAAGVGGTTQSGVPGFGLSGTQTNTPGTRRASPSRGAGR